jgi:hypothetical protein
MGYQLAFLEEPNQRALLQGNLIEAVKLTREANQLGLKESKDLVDAYIAGRPDLRERFAATQAASRRSCLIAALILAAVIGGLVYALNR